MNTKLLDSQLRKLTDEEIEARDGKETDYSGFQFIEDSGRSNVHHDYEGDIIFTNTSNIGLFLDLS